MVESTAKLREEILAISGVDIMENANEFKSTYKIMDELAAKWENLTDIQQATVTELIAGKRQGNIVSSLMTNFDTARDALETSLGSEGSALEEHAKYAESLEFRLNSLKASWQSFAQTFMDSDTLKIGIDALRGLVDILEWLIDNFGIIGTLGLGVAGKNIFGYFKGAKEAKKTLSDVVDAINDIPQAISNVANASTEVSESMANVASATTEVGEASVNTASSITEVNESISNMAAVTTESAESASNLASTTTETAESMANLSSTATETAESLSNVSSAATESVESITNVASASTEAAEATTNLVSSGTEFIEAAGNIASTTTEGAEAVVNLGSSAVTAGAGAKKAAGGFKAFASSTAGIVTGVGLAVAAIALIINAYKNYKEKQSEIRQEAIETADTFLEASSSFEQAYIKYSGKTSLTAEEESDLETAIKGTVDALGDKSNALKGVVNSSNDYLKSLERIKDAELKAAKDAADEKRRNAKKELEEVALGWIKSDGSEVDIDLDFISDGSQKTITDVAKKHGYYYKYESSRGDNTDTKAKLDADATIDEIIGYYYMLQDAKKQLEEAGLENSTGYDRVIESIGKMSDAIEVYESGVYEAVKAQYQLKNGIPKTTEEYLKMRNAILKDKDIKDKSFDTKQMIADTLDAELGQAFDLSTVEARARKFVGIIKGFGDGSKDGSDEIGTVETFLNIQTAVNDNKCTVGQYLKEYDNITSMAEKFSEEEREAFNLEFGLDTDAIKEQYDDIHSYLLNVYDKNNSNKPNIALPDDVAADLVLNRADAYNDVTDFLNSLTATELQAVINLKAEIDWKNTSTEDIRKQIKEEAKLIEALNFEVSIEVDKTALETLNTALEESASAMGLSEEAIDSLKSKYADLEGYDPSVLFERTGNGIKVNREELAKLEKKYNDLNKSEVQEHIDSLTEAYNDNAAAIDECRNAGERAQLIAKGETYKNKIEELAEYQAQLEGVTGAYQRWLDAQNTPEDYEGYELVATSREDIKDEIDRGFISNASKEYIDLLSGEDLQGGTIDDYANAWGKLDDKITGAGHSINDFFTVNDDGDITAAGIDRFFKSVQTDFKGSIAEFNEETGKWEYNFSQENLQKIQDEWGLGIEAIELLLEAAGAAGYDVDWDGLLDNLDLDTAEFETLVSYAESAQSELNKLKGYEDLKFNFTTTNVADATTEFERARKAYVDLITNDDGTVNIEAEGAEEMRVILSTLLVQKQQLSTPAIMKVDTSQIDQAETDIIDVINKAQALQKAYENYEIAISTGVDVEGAKKDLNSAIDGMKGTSVDVRADLKLPTDDELQTAKDSIGDIEVGASLDGTAIGNIESTIQTQCTPEVIAKVTGLDETAIENGSQKVVYTADHKDVDDFVNSLSDISKKIIYTYTTEGTKPNPKNIERTITYKYETEGDVPEAYGTANANGTTGRAFARGNWGIKGNGTALGGELGQELVVRDGKFFTIGDKGAEFFHYKKNDIIFNAAQTESLFKYGGIKGAKPRGTMLAGGTAFAEGNAFPWSATGATSNFANKRKNTSAKKAKTETKTTAKDNSVTTTTTTSWNADAKETNFANNRKSESQKASSSTDKDKDKFEETIDFVEIALSRIEREVDNLDKKANNVYKSWSSRNAALTSEISKVGDEIALQQSAYDRYIKEANSVGLSSSWASKVRDGSIDISTITDEKLAEKIKDYQTWYNKALDCKDAILELQEQESKLYAQRFENIQTQYDGILQGYEHTEAMLNEYISQAEAQGLLISKKYYNALIENEKSNISELKKEQADLIAERDRAVAEDKITKGSEAWYEQCAAIDEVTQAIEAANTKLIEYNNNIRDIDWQKFDLIQERISDITAESEFLIELMSNKDLFDDNGKLTEQGAATTGLHAQNYNVSMYQADEYGKEIAKLDKQLAKAYDGALEERRRELIELQRESILAAENEKNAIKDLVEEGINLELDALQERIDLHNEELDSMKDLYDYQKNVEEQTKNIASLRKQLGAYEGFDDEETRAKVQELKVSLEEAEADLQETEYDKFISDQTALLDTLYTEYETVLNSRLDNIDFLLQGVIDGINAAASEEGAIATALGSSGAIASAIVNAMGENGTIKTILNTEANNVGATLSLAMNDIWSVGEGNAKSVLTKYGEGFQSQQTTTNAALNNIKTDVAAMVDDVDKDAQKKVTANKTSTSAKKDPTKDTKPATKPATNANANKPSGDGKPKVGDKVKFIKGKYYYDSQGKSPAGSKNLGKEVYITKINDASWATHQIHISTGKTLGSGDLGWLKKEQISGFATGKKNISDNQYAWTQEKGQEFIVRPSDGAILTPVAKGDSVLNATASGNIWSMANNPAEFIRDNLKLDTANVPNNGNIQSNYTQHLDKVVFNLPNVKNYDELLSAMQKDKNFEKLILSMSIDRIAGKSSLAKGKSIR